jgi:hypothetical protein
MPLADVTGEDLRLLRALRAGAMPPAQAAPPAPSPIAATFANNPFETDPGYMSALAAEQQGGQQIDAALKAAQEQSLVQYGDPSIAKSLGLSLDPTTAAAAAANPYSTVKGIGRAHEQNQSQIVNYLAAHGMVNSGDLGYRTGLEATNYGQNLYDAGQQLTQYLGGLSRDAVAQKQGLRGNTTSALGSAYDRYVSNPALYGAATAGVDTTPSAGGPAGREFAAPSFPTGLEQHPPAFFGGAGVKSKLAKKPLVNPYTTGQKRFG